MLSPLWSFTHALNVLRFFFLFVVIRKTNLKQTKRDRSISKEIKKKKEQRYESEMRATGKERTCVPKISTACALTRSFPPPPHPPTSSLYWRFLYYNFTKIAVYASVHIRLQESSL